MVTTEVSAGSAALLSMKRSERDPATAASMTLWPMTECVCMYVCMYVCVTMLLLLPWSTTKNYRIMSNVCAYVCMYICMYVCIYVCMRVRTCAYLCMFLCVCVCVWLWSCHCSHHDDHVTRLQDVIYIYIYIYIYISWMYVCPEWVSRINYAYMACNTDRQA
jgi:hypothetical protein